MIPIVINVLILGVCAFVIARSPTRPWAYWLIIVVFVAAALIVSGLAGHQFGGGVGLAALIFAALAGRTFLRPHLIRLRQGRR